MKSIAFFIIAMCIHSADFAQERIAGKKNYYIIPQAALLNGDEHVSAQVALLGGMEKNGWGIGAGAAIDYYKVRTVPVFVDIRKDITRGAWPVSVYTDLGASFPAALESQKRSAGFPWQRADSKYYTGVFAEAGIGYSMLNKKQKGLVLSIGYSMKTITEKYNEIIYADFPPYQPIMVERKLGYTFNRLVLKAGFRL